MIDDDAVFLDVGANVYFCLPAVGGVLSLRDGAVQAAAALAKGLRDSGLAVADHEVDAPGKTVSPARRTGRALVVGRAASPATWRHWAAILVGLWTASRPRSLQRLLPADGAPSARAPSEAMLNDLEVFQRISPWLPVDGTCLFRSGMLRAYLQRLGHRADWVFGVRTWPFRAHCWLQAGDVALDDEAERLIAYHAILVR
jgi:hypothetical protein